MAIVHITVSEGRYREFNQELVAVDDQSFPEIVRADPRRALRLLSPLLIEMSSSAINSTEIIEQIATYDDGSTKVEQSEYDQQTAAKLIGRHALREYLSYALEGSDDIIQFEISTIGERKRKKRGRSRTKKRVETVFELNKDEIRTYLQEAYPGEEAERRNPRFIFSVQTGHIAIFDKLAQDKTGVDFRSLAEQSALNALNVLLTVQLSLAVKEGTYTGKLDGMLRTVTRESEGEEFMPIVSAMITQYAEKLLQQTGTLEVTVQPSDAKNSFEPITFVVQDADTE